MGEGKIILVESMATLGNGNLKLTGSLGDVRSPWLTRTKRRLSFLLGYQRERGARAQLDQDALV